MWVAVAFVGAVLVGEVVTELALNSTWSGFCYETHTLLQRNALAGILRGFGRFGLPVPPGDAISRFRDEPPSITLGSMDGVADLVGRGLFAVVGGVVMWRIDPVLTLAAFAPVVISSAVSDALGTRSAKHAAAARESTGQLSAFLGDLFGATLAVRVAGAGPHVGAPARRDQRHPPAAIGARQGVRRDRELDELPPRSRRDRSGVAPRSQQDPIGSVFRRRLRNVRRVPRPADLSARRDRTGPDRVEADASLDRSAAHAHARRVEGCGRRTCTDLCAAAPLPPLPPVPTRDRLERVDVVGLTCVHPTSGRGVVDASLSLERGSFTVVTGRIGSGKSTLLHALLGLLPSTAGESVGTAQRSTTRRRSSSRRGRRSRLRSPASSARPCRPTCFSDGPLTLQPSTPRCGPQCWRPTSPPSTRDSTQSWDAEA